MSVELAPPQVALDAAGAFPTLDSTAMDILRPYGEEEVVEAGTVLFAPGDLHRKFYVVLDGEAVIVDGDLEGDQRVVVRHKPGRFIGDTTVLTHQAATLTCVFREPGRVLAIPVERLRDVMNREPSLSEVILRAFLLRHSLLTQLGVGVRIIGSRFDAASREVLRFLARNRVAVAWVDVETDSSAESMLRHLNVDAKDIPIVVAGRGLLKRPALTEVAAALGIGSCITERDDQQCDLVVIGAGPAGLAAAVYGASEGLSTVLIDGSSIGGQAGTSSRIENYLGFPAGLSGEELATRAALQAEKFGARIVVPREVVSMTNESGFHVIELDDRTRLRARSVIIATGASYRRLPLDRLEDFEGAGVYYAATSSEASLCAQEPVAIVGGGNSAGQAAVFLSSRCREVHLFIRRDALDATMSRYLIEQIQGDPNIHVYTTTEVTELQGEHTLRAVAVRDSTTGQHTIIEVTGLFVFIGADPCTSWLDDQLVSRGGFLVTGSDLSVNETEHPNPPLPLETSRLGVFCVGDARFGSVKRVASAVGEGSMAVRLVHDRLSTLVTA